MIFFWGSSFILASIFYYVLWLIIPSHRVFGSVFRMLPYHYQFPLQYIVIPCFFYGVLANLFANNFKKSKITKQMFLTLLIIVLTIFISLPFGGILWHFHDMKAGFFPEKWMFKLVNKGVASGFGIGWYIILLSIPYNILGAIVCFFLTKKGAEICR